MTAENYVMAGKILPVTTGQAAVIVAFQNSPTESVVFRSHGGEDSKENLVTLCECCHKAVHSRNLWIEFDMELPEVFHFIRKAGWRPK